MNEMIQFPAPLAPQSVFSVLPLFLFSWLFSVFVLPPLCLSSFPGGVLKHINVLINIFYRNGHSWRPLAKENKPNAKRQICVFSHWKALEFFVDPLHTQWWKQKWDQGKGRDYENGKGSGSKTEEWLQSKNAQRTRYIWKIFSTWSPTL